MTTVLTAGAVCPPGPPAPGWVAIEGGLVVEVGAGAARPGPGVVDLGDVVLAPGFLDLQVNGLGNVDFATADADNWAHADRALVETGTTGYCATFVSAPLDSYEQSFARARAARERTDTILGVHLEGPFLGDAPGAHSRDLLRPVDLGWLEHVLATQTDLITLVTLAPEADPGCAAMRLLASRSVVVALGHSTASYEDARAAADAGATVVTHLFNGMGPLHHRGPGLAGAALTDHRLTPTLIADFVHVHRAALQLAIAAKRSVALVTDAVAIGDRGFAVVDGAARLPDGTLAGSTLTLDRAVANVVGLGVPVERAIEMATAIPAEVLGLRDRGRLAPGVRADIVALDPVSLAVRAVWLEGEPVLAN
ncbi:MAG: N-acetylglucosamine-6-phosphate deacetylase [Acidimicrobiia bacterium]